MVKVGHYIILSMINHQFLRSRVQIFPFEFRQNWILESELR